MCTRKLKNRSDHATFHVVFIHFEPDEKKEAKRRRLKNTCVISIHQLRVSTTYAQVLRFFEMHAFKKCYFASHLSNHSTVTNIPTFYKITSRLPYGSDVDKAAHVPPASVFAQ